MVNLIFKIRKMKISQVKVLEMVLEKVVVIIKVQETKMVMEEMEMVHLEEMAEALEQVTIKKYIQDQEKADIMQDKLSVKEYEDPFKGQG